MSNRHRHTTEATPTPQVDGKPEAHSPMRWMPSLSLAVWLPVAIMLTSMVLYKRIGVDNDFITYYASWLFLPWVLAPLVERLLPQSLSSKAAIVAFEATMGLLTVAIATDIASGAPANALAMLFFLVGLCGVAHDVEAARLVHRHKQRIARGKAFATHAVAFFIALTVCHGLAVSFAGNMEVLTRNVRHSWRITFYILAATFAALALLHCATLPRGGKAMAEPMPKPQSLTAWIMDMAKKPSLLLGAACMVLYLLPEGLVMPTSTLFVIDARHNGGLGMSPSEYGFAWGTVGMAGLTAGLLVGMWATGRRKPGWWLWAMAIAATLPNGIYLYLSHEMPTDLTTVALCLLARQTLTGFGLSICLHSLSSTSGDKATPRPNFRHTSLAAMAMLLGGLYSGTLQEAVGYRSFFAVAIAASALTLAATALALWIARHRKNKG